VIRVACRIASEKDDILLAKTSYYLYIDKVVSAGPGSDWVHALIRTSDGVLVAVSRPVAEVKAYLMFCSLGSTVGPMSNKLC